MDIEKFSNLEVQQSSVKSITDACNEMKKLEAQIELDEEQLAKKKKRLRDYVERKVPELMQEAGVNALVLSDGSKVEVKPFYAARIPESRTQEAFSWLRDGGFEDLIKNQVTASFNKGQDNLVAKLISVCEENNFRYTKKEKVEPMTLKAFVREQVEKGKELPFDLFGVYIANKANFSMSTVAKAVFGFTVTLFFTDILLLRC